MEDERLNNSSYLDEQSATNSANTNSDHGWQKVVYPKRQRKTSKPSDSNDLEKFRSNGPTGKSNVFSSVEQQGEERRRRVLELQRKALAEEEEGIVPRLSKQHHSDGESDSEGEGAVENEKQAEETKKPKPKKVKKVKVTVAEAAEKIDVADLESFLIEVTGSYESQQDIQLMRFADYFARAFSAVKNAEFPWAKMLKEYPIAKMADIPLNDVPEPVYKTSADWINKRSSEALSSFILFSLDTILADMVNQQGATKGSKKVVQQGSSKAQVAIFVVLAIALRRKPEALISLLPKLREDPRYQGQDKLPVLIWITAQASQGDLVVGLYSWVHNLFPLISGKSCNTQSRDLVLQLLERILSAPKSRSILLNGAVRKGERLVPPSTLELLLRATFPAPASRIKATERFEAAYPILKELALAGTPGSKAMKQVTQQIFSFAVKEAGEGVPELSNEASSIAIWCLTQNHDCYKLWDKIYLDNVEASVSILKKLSDEWREHGAKHASLDPLKEAIKSFRLKNEEALSDGEDASKQSSFRASNKYCKVISGRVSRGHGCVKSLLFAVVVASVGAVIMSPEVQSWDWNKLSVLFNTESF